MSRLKTVLIRGYQANSSYGRRFFSHSTLPPNWKQMSEDEKISFAINEENPETADEAYYKGLGLLAGGKDLIEESAYAFKQAITFSNGSHWLATIKLANIYSDLGQDKKAYETMVDAIKKLHTAILSDSNSLDKFLISTNSTKINSQQKDTSNLNHGEEKIWLTSWKLSQQFAQLGQYQKAFNALNSATEYLDSILSNNNDSLDYLKDKLSIEVNNFEDHESGVSKFI